VARNVRSQKDAGQKGNVGRRVWLGRHEALTCAEGLQAYEEFKRDGQIGGDNNEEVRTRF